MFYEIHSDAERSRAMRDSLMSRASPLADAKHVHGVTVLLVQTSVPNFARKCFVPSRTVLAALSLKMKQNICSYRCINKEM